MYLIGLCIITLLAFVVSPTYAKFVDTYVTDDDIVEEGGVLNQYSESPVANNTKEKEKVEEIKEVKVATPDADVKYDLYDDVVTKDELIDAIKIAKETNDSSVLDMLLEQEELNRKKEHLKNNESKKTK